MMILEEMLTLDIPLILKWTLTHWESMNR